jgi:peptidyl-dipeptidase Dcp
MSAYRSQSRNDNDAGEFIYPIIVNNNNFNKGDPTLLSFDDANTLFHEFGHGMHGMLSDVTYKRLSGTNVLRDFVELPSQLMEHWLKEPKVLKKHARHYQTQEPLPDELFARLMAAQSFNNGFDTIEYTACALLDQALHKLPEADVKELKLDEFEKTELARLGMPQGIALRHRLPHFQHMFASSYYAAGYYVYLWAEVLDADGFAAFTDAGDCFDKETARRVRQFIYSAGNSREPGELYRAFRGRDPVVEPMLKKKGMMV